MAFWPMLGTIAAEVGLKLLDSYLHSGDSEKTPALPAPPPRQAPSLSPANRDNIMDVCQRVYEGDLDPVDGVGNMRRNLYQKDPKVVKMALKVMESVLEERGIPARNNDEASQFLTDMRELLRHTSDRSVEEGIFELNQAWARACQNSQQFRGVGDLIDLLNAEGYRITVSRDNRSQAIENIRSVYCSICDSQLPFDHLKHFCQFCRRVFCSSCCSYQPGIPPFQGNPSVCICHECKAKNNSNFSPQVTPDFECTIPKVYNNAWESSSEMSVQQRARVGDGKSGEEDVKINLVVPRHVADNPEGWTLTVQCTKSENDDSKDTAQNKKKNNELQWTLEHSKDKVFEKDVWQEEHKWYSSEGENEAEDMKLAIQRSSQSAKEEMQMQIALEISRRENERKSDDYETSEEDELQDTRRGARRKAMNKSNAAAAFEVRSNHYWRKGNPSKEYSEKSRQQYLKYEGNEDGNNEEDKELGLALRRSLEENPRKTERSSSGTEDDDKGAEDDSTKPACCCKCKHEKDKRWEEQEALERAMRISLEEFKQKERSASVSQNGGEGPSVGSISNSQQECCCKHAEGKNWEEQEAVERAIKISLQEFKQKEHSASGAQHDDESSAVGSKPNNKEAFCCKYAKDKSWEEQEALERAMRISLEEFKQKCSASGSQSDDEDSEDKKSNIQRLCFNCGKAECVCEEESSLPQAIELSRKESVKEQLCFNCGKEECECEEGSSLRQAIELSRRVSVKEQLCFNCGKAECVCEEESSLQQAIELSRRESVKKQLCFNCGKAECVCEEESSLQQAIELSRRESVKKRRLRYFELKNSKKELESLGRCSPEFPERNEKQWEEDCHVPDAERNKIDIIEDAEIKLAMQLSLQEMLQKEQNDRSENDPTSNENDDTDSSSENSEES